MASGKYDGKLLQSGICKFALELYKRQGNETRGNIFLSPLSISAVLSMACLGAKGQTLEEIKASLFLNNLDDSQLHQQFSDLHLHFMTSSAEVNHFSKEPVFRLFMANRLYGEKSYNFLEEYQNACKKYYHATLEPVDFIADPKKTTDQINKWVSERTNEKIKDIITPDFIDESTRLILVNAIYFKSEWQSPFEKCDTQDAEFFVSAQETVKTQMMYQKIERARYHHSSSLLCQIVQLPYLHGKLSMFVLLPDKESSLAELESKLSVDDIEGLDSFKQYPDVKLWLPKFKIEETLELTKILSSMGMKRLFTMGEADLSGIDGTKNLYASKVVHKAFVDVNEEGTEAAGATALRCVPMCLHIPMEVVDFRADRPFLFFIREEATKIILFLGRLVRP